MSLAKKITIAVICIALTGGIVFAMQYTMDSKESKAVKVEKNEKKVEKVATSKIKDGEYFGEAQGFGGLLKVKVTIKSGKISGIELVSHNETPEYLNAAKDVIDRIISKGDVDVDSVAGATISSNAIKKAVA